MGVKRVLKSEQLKTADLDHPRLDHIMGHLVMEI